MRVGFIGLGSQGAPMAGRIIEAGFPTSLWARRPAALEPFTGTAAQVAPSKAERRAEAKAKGYEGEMCSECGNFTLVRNGTCMKCDTCGSTTGCS